MKLFIIAKSNMKKKKSNLIILFLLISIATMLLYTGVNVLTKINTFMIEKNEAQNGPHAQFITTTGYKDEVTDLLKKVEGFKKLDSDEILMSISTNKLFNEHRDKESEEMPFIMVDYESNKSIPNIKVLEKGKEYKENSIIVPMYMKVAKGYKVGDTIKIETSKKTYEYEIYGFIEDVMYATISNISIYRCYIPHDEFVKLKDNDSSYMLYDQYNVRLTDVNKSKAFEENTLKQMREMINDGNFSSYMGLNFTTMRMGTGMFINILMAILAVFAFFILAISIIVIRFSIITNIENNLSNVGILEAVGYTTKQLALASIIEYIIIATLGIVAGLLMSIASSFIIGSIVSGSIGLVWKPAFDIMVALISAFLVALLVLIVTFISTRKYNKITPLDALREGIKNHNFKKNPFALSKTKLGLNTALGMKSMFHNKKQNISIMIIVLLLSFICTICLALYYNFVVEDGAMINLVGIEKPDISLTKPDILDKTVEEIEEEIIYDKEVNSVLQYGYISITVQKGEKEMSIGADVYNKQTDVAIDNLIEGRRPKHSNEINLTTNVLEGIGAEVGDTITVSNKGDKKSFIVVGKTQQISNMGLRAIIMESGAQELIESYNCNTLYIYLKDNVNIPNKVDEYKDHFKEKYNIEVTNFDLVYQTILNSFSKSLSAICILFVGITIFVIALIIHLVVKMKLINERRYMGIYKALGYTTSQIIWQTVIHFAPIVSIGGLIGAMLGAASMGKVTALSLSMCGIENAQMIVPTTLVVGIFIAITFSAFLLTLISAIRIRKIEPYKMIVEM